MQGEIRQVMITLIVNCKLNGVILSMSMFLNGFVLSFFSIYFSLILNTELETYNHALSFALDLVDDVHYLLAGHRDDNSRFYLLHL